MSQEPDNRIPTPVANQIGNCRELIVEYKRTDVCYLALNSTIAALEMLIDSERAALISAHASARGIDPSDPIAILWFTKTFLPYVKSPK